MGWSLRNKENDGSYQSGITTETVDIAVTSGDLIIAQGLGSVDPTAIEDTESHSWTLLEDLTDGGANINHSQVWYTIATITTTITITVTFGTDTGSHARYINAAAFNPGGDTINFVTDDTTDEDFTTSVETGAISATENDVLGIAHLSIGGTATFDTLLIAGSSPDDSQSPYIRGHQFWTIFSSGVSSKTAYVSIVADSWLILTFALFELQSAGGGVSIPIVMHHKQQMRRRHR